jgi:hypothetical protein
MSDISEAGLAKRIEELSAENASLKSENKDRRIRNKAAATELDQLKAQLATITADRDTHKATATALPGEKDAQIADLTGKLLARDHRDAFAAVKDFDGPVDPTTGKAPKHKLADGVTIDALWQLAKYKAEGATPDAQTVAKTLGEAAKAHPFLFSTVDTAADAAARPIVVAAREGGPGAGKGETSASILAASAASAVRPASGMVEGRL